MWHYNPQNFKLFAVIHSLSRSWTIFESKLRNAQFKIAIAPLSLFTLLGLGAVTWTVQSAIAPIIAQAYTARVDVSITRLNNESYQTMISRAEAIARAATQRSFDQDILITDVAVMIVAQNDGFIAPMLSLRVTRQQWKRSPDPRGWITYYPDSMTLLQFDQQKTNISGQSGTTIAPGLPSSPQEPIKTPEIVPPKPENPPIAPGNETSPPANVPTTP